MIGSLSPKLVFISCELNSKKMNTQDKKYSSKLKLSVKHILSSLIGILNLGHPV